MSVDTGHPVMARIERLERDNRVLRRIAAIPLLVAIAVVVMGQAAPRSKVVEAQRFALVDPNGKTVGGLNVDERGPSLSFFDASGLRANLTTEALVLYDRHSETRIVIRVQDDGTAGAVF